jgi:hypothetical protein
MHPNLAFMENQILKTIDELEEEITAGNTEKIITLANTIVSAVSERNMKLKSLN